MYFILSQKVGEHNEEYSLLFDVGIIVAVWQGIFKGQRGVGLLDVW